MHSYKVEYWYLLFHGEDDLGYDYGTVEVEAEDEQTAIEVAKLRAPRGAKAFKVINE